MTDEQLRQMAITARVVLRRARSLGLTRSEQISRVVMAFRYDLDEFKQQPQPKEKP